ncbi:hypothetical protein DQ04_18081000 [Trypanosoma grayi]|uniref:hypothetical protein n=1 Tax=Trypanosoma grayi TaxID=71804 RepID=UPI0004F4A281|nr:hypothetical protein DQ04_18081000 [Trypanosoma grayi]KEG05829.1 hypothetical protein DQ04_18081000 [Trypanosoma grayi]
MPGTPVTSPLKGVAFSSRKLSRPRSRRKPFHQLSHASTDAIGLGDAARRAVRIRRRKHVSRKRDFRRRKQWLLRASISWPSRIKEVTHRASHAPPHYFFQRGAARGNCSRGRRCAYPQ